MRFLFTIALLGCLVPAAPQQRIVVASDGSGDFRTVQGAINSLPDSADRPRIIFIRKGEYRKKIYLEKANLILEGEDREQTIISASIARDAWRCSHRDDWGVATINIGANDITLKNLTVSNRFGFEYQDTIRIACPNDTLNGGLKQLRRDGHQMAVRTMGATRMKAVNCRFRSFGGDTMSPWNVESGLWYFKDCIMEGGVDLYCPRGWAWAENCEFIAHSGSAAIWHDGSANADSKSVLINCRFSGYDGFRLGRYHRDAQLYLINCVFAANMRDEPIGRVPNAAPFRWGHRVYYADCKREGGNDFAWYANQLPKGLTKKDITINWVFQQRWNPEK